MKTAALLVLALGCGSPCKKTEPPVTPPPAEKPVEPAPAHTEETGIGTPPETPAAISNDDLATTAKAWKGQAAIAWKLNQEGVELVNAGKYPEASAKFRDAAARVPEAAYFVNLCMSLYQEGKFDEALVACHAADNSSPTPKQKTVIDNMMVRIKTEAQRQGVIVKP